MIEDDQATFGDRDGIALAVAAMTEGRTAKTDRHLVGLHDKPVIGKRDTRPIPPRKRNLFALSAHARGWPVEP